MCSCGGGVGNLAYEARLVDRMVMVKPSSLTLRERNAMRFCSVHSTGTDPSVLFPEGGGVDSRKQKTQCFSPPGRVCDTLWR